MRREWRNGVAISMLRAILHAIGTGEAQPLGLGEATIVRALQASDACLSTVKVERGILSPPRKNEHRVLVYTVNGFRW